MYAELWHIRQRNFLLSDALPQPFTLRLGCLSHLEAFWAKTDLGSAADELRNADQLFMGGGDETGRRLIDAHLSFVAVIQRDRQQTALHVDSIL
jgi:hypothetical protein